MSAAFFNQLADPKKAKAISAGTQPGERVHPEVVEVMKEVGSDLSSETPKYLSPEVCFDREPSGHDGLRGRLSLCSWVGKG